MRRLLVAAGVVIALATSAGCNDADKPSVTSDGAAAPLKLEIRPVVALVDKTDKPSRGDIILEDPDATPEQTMDGLGSSGPTALELGPAQLTAADIDSAKAEAATAGSGWQILVEFTSDGNAKFLKLTKDVGCRTGPENRIAIVVDDEILSAPTVNVACGTGISDGTSVSGDFTEDEAKDLAERINDGQ